MPPLPGDEARFVQAAREMRARDDWVVPTVGGAPRYDKPILVYWLLLASQAALGETPAAARLPSNLAAALTVGLVAWWARRRWGHGAGLTAGVLLAATFAFQVEARASTADAALLLPTVIALLALERLYRGEGGAGTRIALWVGLGVAVLAKGPVGPAVAAATAVAAWGLGRSWRWWELSALAAALLAGWAGIGPVALAVPAAYALAHVVGDPAGRRGLGALGAEWGAPLAVAIVLPWAAAAYVATDGEFLRAAIGRHVVSRSLIAFEGHGGVPGWYLVTGFIAAFPWFALLGPALGALVGRLRTDAAARFLVAWLLGPLILFELARTKLVHYWLPAYPAGVLLVTAWLFQSGARALPSTRLGAAAAWLTVIAGLLLAGAPVAAGRYFDLDAMVPPALVAALPLLVGLLVFAGTARSRLRLGTTALAVGAALQLAIVAGPCLRRLSEAVVERRAARALLAARASGEAVVVYRVRDADALVTLPLGTAVCAAPECVDTLVTAHGRVVGVGSGEGVAELHRRRANLRIEWLAAVTGLDLVHGRWERWIVFRVGRDGETAS